MGAYVENIVVQDRFMDQAPKFRVKVIVGREVGSPILKGIDQMTITVGDPFDPLAKVQAIDGFGNDITARIQIIGNTVNVKEAGVYEVVYRIEDEAGSATQRSRKIIVNKKR